MTRALPSPLCLFLLSLGGLLLLGTAGVTAQDYSGFRTVSTEHFTFVYEDRDHETVARLVDMADEV